MQILARLPHLKAECAVAEGPQRVDRRPEKLQHENVDAELFAEPVDLGESFDRCVPVVRLKRLRNVVTKEREPYVDSLIELVLVAQVTASVALSRQLALAYKDMNTVKDEELV